MRRTADPILLEQQRFNAARMHDLGLEPTLIAASLDFDDQTVRHWIREYKRGGIDALKARLHPGPTPRLGEDQKRQLLELLQQPPSAYAAEGLAGQLWTTARIALLIKNRFGVSYHPSHVGQMMHELDYTQQLPQKKPKPRDPAKIERWRNQQWPAIVQRARATDAVIVFVDEAGYLLEPLRKKMWAPKGQTPLLVHQAGVDPRKVSVIGGLAYPGSTSCSLEQPRLFTQWHPGASVDQQAVVSFLRRLLDECPGNLIVVWDNLPAHRAKQVKALCAAASPRLWLEALPGYAPELNPIEQIWCMSKYHRLANHGIMELEQLHQAARQSTNELANEQELLINCLRHTGLADALYQPGDQ